MNRTNRNPQQRGTANSVGRREFFAKTTAAAAGVSFLASHTEAEGHQPGPKSEAPQGEPEAKPSVPASAAVREDYEGFSRFKPNRGNDPDSDYYLGKLVPGFRGAADGPAPFVAPDLDKLPWKMVNGAKEFHLVPMAVEQEFRPGVKMNVYGYNGSMPGPTIEVDQGDRVRIVVTNELPEDTYVHWHGFELPVQYDGAATLTQNPTSLANRWHMSSTYTKKGLFSTTRTLRCRKPLGRSAGLSSTPEKCSRLRWIATSALSSKTFTSPPLTPSVTVGRWTGTGTRSTGRVVRTQRHWFVSTANEFEFDC